jgi:hypothetical protein
MLLRLRRFVGVVSLVLFPLILPTEAQQEPHELSAAQFRGSASCSIDPNPVPLGDTYRVEGANVGSNRALHIRVTEGRVTDTYDLVSGVEGTFSFTAQARSAGQGVVEVFGFRRNLRRYRLTRCQFAVTDPASCDRCGAPAIPSSSAWTDRGLFLRAGNPFEWDHILWGGFARNVIKKDGVFFFYYQGSTNYDEVYETVAYRSIGLATSSDGINFEKYPGSPVLSWLPHAWLEEGAVSAAPLVTPKGAIGLFYGANTRIDSWNVNGDGRFALSEDGSVFRDQGIALDHTNRTIWGSGDELYPILSFSDGSRWYVYYLPNGTSVARRLGVAWGSDPMSLSSSAGVTDAGGALVPAWGAGSAAPLGGGDYALFFNNGGTVTVWRMNVAAPDRLTGPIATYAFPNMSSGSLLLDGDTWYLYYLNDTYDGYGVRTAPAY